MRTDRKAKSKIQQDAAPAEPPQRTGQKYPQSLQENLLTALFHVRTTGKYIADTIDVHLFEAEYRVLAERAIDYWRKYGKPPRMHGADLVDEYINNPKDPRSKTYRRILLSMQELADAKDGKYVNLNPKYVRDQLQRFVQQQRLKLTIVKSAETLDAGGPDAANQVNEILRKHLLGAPTAGHEIPREVSAHDLQDMDFPSIKYVVPGYIIEGLTLLAAKPKVGKSWMMLGIALGIANRDLVLGDIECKQGDVLYCALEDGSLRRCQYRIKKLIGDREWPKRLHMVAAMPRLDQGGLNFLQDWVKRVKRPRAIIIDTLKMVRKSVKDRGYDADYDSVSALRDFAVANHVAVVLVHHLRKAESEDDAFDTVSGTLGLTGAVDTVLVIKRKGDKFTLHGHGRDLAELEKALAFDPKKGVWTVLGDAAEVHMSQQRVQILRVLKESSEPIKPVTIAHNTNMPVANVQFLLGKMIADGDVEKSGYGKYRVKRKDRD